MAGKRGIGMIILLVMNWIAALLLPAAYFAAFVDPEKYWFFSFIGLAYPVILALNLVFVFIWLLLWKRYILISLLAIFAGWGHLTSVYPLRFKAAKVNGEQNIRVVTYNIHGYSWQNKTLSRKEVQEKTEDFIRGEKPDLLFLQEFYRRGNKPDSLMAEFAVSHHLPYYAYSNYNGKPPKKVINSIAIFSGYRIIRSDFMKLPRQNVFAVFADVLMEKDTVRLYNLHLESFRFGPEDYSFYSNLTEPDDDKKPVPITLGSKRMYWKLRKAFITRAMQVKVLNEHMQNCRYPIIMAGDFNDSPYSYTYRKLVHNKEDAYKAAGKGLFGATYSGKFPSFRIDYILFSGSFRAIKYQRSDLTLSDHYPVSATLTR